PPELGAEFSKVFQEFVALCLKKDPAQRPTAEQLLKHKFIRSAKRTEHLTDLIKRWQSWKKTVPESRSKSEPANAPEDDEHVAWDFGSVRHALPATPQKPSQPPPAVPARQLHASASSSTANASTSSLSSSNMSALPAPPPIGAGHGNRSRSGSTASNVSSSGGANGLGIGAGNRVPSGFGSNIPPPSPGLQPRHVNNASPVNIANPRSNLGPGFGSSTPPPQSAGSRPSSSHQSSGSPSSSRLQQAKIATPGLLQNPQPQRAAPGANGRQSSPEDLYHNVLMPTLVRLEKLTSNSQAKAAYCTLAETIRRLEHEIPGFADVFSKELTLSVNKFYQTWRE
ncbi:hypothetical protein FBU31_004644, partial [Coemansia sp. 'formosensis']